MNPRPHWISIFSFSFLLVNLILLAAIITAPIFLLPLVGFPTWRWLQFKSQKFEITPTYARMADGVLVKDSNTLAFKNIVSIQCRQSVLGRIFGWGDVLMVTAGKSGMIWKQMRDPKAISSHLESLVTP